MSASVMTSLKARPSAISVNSSASAQYVCSTAVARVKPAADASAQVMSR
jgi:hypothetical protein